MRNSIARFVTTSVLGMVLACSIPCFFYANLCNAASEIDTDEKSVSIADNVIIRSDVTRREKKALKQSKRNKKIEFNSEKANVTVIPNETLPPIEVEPPVIIKPLELTISFAGDCTLGEFKGMGYEGSVSDYYDKYGPEWFFANVKPIFSEDDITYVNLEGPLTNIPQQVEKQFPMKGDVRNVNALVNGSVEVCNLANNHTWDCGDAGLRETEAVLRDNGIYYCGGTASCVFVERKGVKLAFLGFHGWDQEYYTRELIKDEIAKAKAAGAELIIAQFHWGEEREYVHNWTQEVLAHLAVDSGADIVVGGHAHVLQDTEYYKGKLICYSMGNFSFGANLNPWDKDSVIIQQTFVKKENGFEYGTTKFIPCRISSIPDYNDFKPTPYIEKVDMDRVFAKLRVQ